MGAHDRSTTVVLVGDGEVEVVIGRLVGSRPDVGLVDALARLQLEAHRRGCSIRLRDPCPEVRLLLELVGMADVLGLTPLRLEARGESERPEELGVEEVVPPRDPPV